MTTSATRLAAARAAIQNGLRATPKAAAMFLFRRQFGIDRAPHGFHNFQWYSYCWKNGLGPSYKPFQKG